MGRAPVSKTPLGKRLTQARNRLGFVQRKNFAEVLGVHPETLGGYERGDTNPDPDFLARYKQDFSVSLDWLVAGEGEMFSSADAAQTIQNTPIDLRRLTEAIAVIEQGLAETKRTVPPAIKAELVEAAYEMLEEPTEKRVHQILRLVKG